MSTIKDAITNIATEAGYDGDKPQTIADAIDALTDTLAGEDVDSGSTIHDAVVAMGGHIAPVPTGTLEITENGEGIDVSDYAAVDVAVSGGGGGGHALGNWVSVGTMEDVADVAGSYLDGYYHEYFLDSAKIIYRDTDVSSEVTLDDIALPSNTMCLTRDGTLLHHLRSNYYWPDVAVSDSSPVEGTYNLDAYLVTPTAIVDGAVTEVSVTPYTGVTFVCTSGGGETYYDISVHDIPDALPAAKTLSDMDMTQVYKLLPAIVWQAKAYD